jgi:hypothetical protein
MRPAEGDIGIASTGPKLAGSQPVAKPLATMVNTMMTRFISRDAPGIDFRPIWVRNGKAWFAKQHLVKVSLSQGANVRFLAMIS